MQFLRSRILFSRIPDRRILVNKFALPRFLNHLKEDIQLFCVLKRKSKRPKGLKNFIIERENEVVVYRRLELWKVTSLLPISLGVFFGLNQICARVG